MVNAVARPFAYALCHRGALPQTFCKRPEKEVSFGVKEYHSLFWRKVFFINFGQIFKTLQTLNLMKTSVKKTFVYFLLGSSLAFISLFSACVEDKGKGIAVTGVSLDVTSPLALNTGESKQLTATVTPANATDKTVTWSSSDIAKVTVDPTGNVKAIAAGEAVIKAKAGDHEASLKVTAAAPAISWTAAPPDDMWAKDDDFTIAAAVPNGATLTYTALDPATGASSLLASVTGDAAQGYKLHPLGAGRGSVKIKVTSSDNTIAPLEKTVVVKDWVASDFVSSGFAFSLQLIIDAHNNIYSAAADDLKILKVDPSGNVTVYAGSGQEGTADGSPTAASFGLIQGIAIDNSGNIYVAEEYSVLRKISAGGTVSTLRAKDPNNTEDGCFKPKFDSNGILYGATQTGINKISLTDGAYIRYAGGESAGRDNGALTAAKFSAGPGYLSLTVVSGNMYVCDWGNALIRKIDMGAGSVSTFSGVLQSGGYNSFASSDGTAPTAKYGILWDIAADMSGNLFVLENVYNSARKDYDEAALRKVDAEGRVKTITRTGIDYARSMVLAPSGDLYISTGYSGMSGNTFKLIKFSYQ